MYKIYTRRFMLLLWISVKTRTSLDKAKKYVHQPSTNTLLTRILPELLVRSIFGCHLEIHCNVWKTPPLLYVTRNCYI